MFAFDGEKPRVLERRGSLAGEDADELEIVVWKKRAVALNHDGDAPSAAGAGHQWDGPDAASEAAGERRKLRFEVICRADDRRAPRECAADEAAAGPNAQLVP